MLWIEYVTLSHIVFSSMQYAELYLHAVLCTVSPCGTSNCASMRYSELYLNADTKYLSIKDMNMKYLNINSLTTKYQSIKDLKIQYMSIQGMNIQGKPQYKKIP